MICETAEERILQDEERILQNDKRILQEKIGETSLENYHLKSTLEEARILQHGATFEETHNI